MKPVPPSLMALAVLARQTAPFTGNLGLLREWKRRYRALYSLGVESEPDGSLRFHHARYFRREGIDVLFLKGDRFEMAFQHGRLLSEAIHRGVLVELNRMIPNMIHNSVTKKPWLNRLLTRALDYLGNNVLLHRVSEEDLRDTFALSEGLGVPLETISGAMLSIEALTILAKYAAMPNGVHIHPMAFSGCSSFAAWGRHTPDGELIVGRNLDYQLNGFFDANPLVAYHEPTDGTQGYVSLGSAGLHTPSLTAFNQSGIFLAVHMVPSAETSFSGTPIYFISSEVVRNARTFDEAAQIFTRAKPTAGWAFLLVSFREKRVGSVEMTYDNVSVIESDSFFHAQTNHFTSPEMQGRDLEINASIERDSMGRWKRLHNLLAASAEPLTARTAAAFLADAVDPYEKRVRGLGATVSVHITVGSYVLDPAAGKLYVANGMAPVCQNDFIEFPWLGSEGAHRFASLPFGRIEGGHLLRTRPQVARAVQRYIEAKVAYENHSDLERAHALLQEVVALDTGNAAYHFVLALFALKLGRFEEGELALGQVLRRDHTAHLHHLAHYYRGRIHAHRGEREIALSEFEAVLSQPSADERITHAAKKARNRVRIFGHYALSAQRLPILMQFADLLVY